MAIRKIQSRRKGHSKSLQVLTANGDPLYTLEAAICDEYGAIFVEVLNDLYTKRGCSKIHATIYAHCEHVNTLNINHCNYLMNSHVLTVYYQTN